MPRLRTVAVAWVPVVAFVVAGVWMLAGVATPTNVVSSATESSATGSSITGSSTDAAHSGAVAPPAVPGEAGGVPAAPDEAAPPASPPAVTRGNADRVDPSWAERVSMRTGIPVRAVQAYGGAELETATSDPGCRLSWSTLAALGQIESGHGTHAGSKIGSDGVAAPAILGPDLDGGAFALIRDTDGGMIDGSSRFDRAVGPLQFIPSTWRDWGVDGSGDGIADPQQIDDAALSTARYLCNYGDLSQPELWRKAIFAYNHLDSYVAAVADAASELGRRAG